MKRDLLVRSERFAIGGGFTISRGTRTHAEVIVCTVEADGRRGRGECVPYRRYGETVESVTDEIEKLRPAIEAGMDRQGLQRALHPGAARNALDCALWDLEAKLTGVPCWQAAGLPAPTPCLTAYTLSLGTPEAMAAQARANASRPLLKVKIGGQGDEERIRAVVEAAPDSRLILDANEGWQESELEANLAMAGDLGVALVEQPLPAGNDALLARIHRPVPVCADESVHVCDDVDALRDRYDAVNIKLDKTGGLTEALLLHRRARELGLGVMIGCMVGTSLAMAPALLLAGDADFVDLDGPLLLEADRVPGLAYAGSLVSPSPPELWG
jgi:L-alanine-DL-glutamate epimerase-like enolase superfamily enzyme